MGCRVGAAGLEALGLGSGRLASGMRPGRVRLGRWMLGLGVVIWLWRTRRMRVLRRALVRWKVAPLVVAVFHVRGLLARRSRWTSPVRFG